METKKYTLVRGRVVWDELTKKAYNRANLPNDVGERLIKTRPDVVLTIDDCEKYGNPTTDEWEDIRERLINVKGFEGVLSHAGDSAKTNDIRALEWSEVKKELETIFEMNEEVEPKKPKKNAKASNRVKRK